MQLGDAFVMSIPPVHLWFVISDPTKNRGTYIIVNLTTDLFRAGKECVLNPGDHPWIRETSYISFADAIEITPEHNKTVTSFIGTKIIMQSSLEPKILRKIIQAAKHSKAISSGFKRYL